jgi:hypothetical protein
MCLLSNQSLAPSKPPVSEPNINEQLIAKLITTTIIIPMIIPIGRYCGFFISLTRLAGYWKPLNVKKIAGIEATIPNNGDIAENSFGLETSGAKLLGKSFIQLVPGGNECLKPKIKKPIIIAKMIGKNLIHIITQFWML